MMPRFTSGCPKVALSDAITKWQLMANSHPPPNANPFTQATTGFGQCSIFENTACPLFATAIACSLVKDSNSFISAPATKLLSPAPVITTLLISGNLYTRSITASKSLMTCLFNAFKTSGRLMVIIKVWSSNFVNKVWNDIIKNLIFIAPYFLCFATHSRI